MAAPRPFRARRAVAALVAAGLSVFAPLAARPATAAPVTVATAAPATAAATACPTNTGLPMPHPVAVASVDIGGCPGYFVVNRDGHVAAFGSATNHGDASGLTLTQPVVGMAATPDGGGYWLVAADGGVFNYGDAGFYGSAGSLKLVKPVVGMAAAPSGKGYWLVAADGGVFNYGAAPFEGSAGSLNLAKPVVGMAAAANGAGYWLVAADGGIFNYGRTAFHGSAASLKLFKPVVGMIATTDGAGYFLVAADGGVFNYGNAPFEGSLGNNPPASGVVGLAATADDKGYLALDGIGNLHPFGDAQQLGSAACPTNNTAVYGVDPDLMASTGGGSQLITVDGASYASRAATLTAWNRQAGGCWAPASLSGQPAMPYRAETGYAGFEDNRREGDGSTPTGIYGFGTTMYGNSTAVPNAKGYQYHHLVAGDYWDENPASLYYNQFEHSANTNCAANPYGGDTECLWQETVDYQHFAVVNFNPPPTRNPIGAAIFLHDDTPSGYTAGCIALPNSELDAVLGWMTLADQPHIAIGVGSEVTAF